jgi:Domain of unknown function (DUF4331)
MSSHREAPEISKDPVADNTDTYAFVPADQPTTVTIIANYIPLQDPPGGPNFFEFGNDVTYWIYIDNDGDGTAEITYQFNFQTTVLNKKTFLYNTGPIASLTDPRWNRRQTYTVQRIDGANPPTVLGSGLACPPCNIGPRSTPNYDALATAAIQTLPHGEKVFAGQRSDPFFVDLGAIFDLGTIRPIEALHLISTPDANSVDSLKKVNVHSIVLQVPISKLTSDGSVPTDVFASKSVLGIWAASSRQKNRLLQANGTDVSTGTWVQVSRLGNPLFNEVVVPLGAKDAWNASDPINDATYLPNVKKPELAGLLPVLYPTAFPHLKAYTKDRADLEAILLTGIPKTIIPGFQNLSANLPTGKVADMLRLNVAVKPTTPGSENPLGLVGSPPDLAGFPNGRRLLDDVVNIELKAIAGATIPLVDSTYIPDGAVAAVDQKLVGSRFQSTFPYVTSPHDGFDTAL